MSAVWTIVLTAFAIYAVSLMCAALLDHNQLIREASVTPVALFVCGGSSLTTFFALLAITRVYDITTWGFASEVMVGAVAAIAIAYAVHKIEFIASVRREM